MTTETQATAKPSAVSPATSLSLAYLRAFVMVMVVLHHSVLAYFADGPLPPKSLTPTPRWWQAFPVVDPAKWSGFTPFVLFNDSYTMALLFLVSGLFTWRSLKRKGPARYFGDRLVRLGVPLLVMVALSLPMYYATYLQGGMHDGYLHEYASLKFPQMHAGWFLLALLIFDLIAIAVYAAVPRLLEAIGRRVASVSGPLQMVAIITLFSTIFYLPLFLRFGPYSATRFSLPLTRVSHDLSYFLLGLAIGSAGIESSLISAGGRLAASWRWLVLAAPLGMIAWQGSIYLSHRHWNPPVWEIVIAVCFCLSCAISVFAALAVFLRFVKQPRPAFDSLAASAFGIYVIHGGIVIWTQMALLPWAAPGWLKGGVVFLFSLPLCWWLVTLARRSKRIAHIL